jgi:predicted acyl esterase
MSKNVYRDRRKSNMFYPLAMILFACLVLSPPVFGASNPLEMFPEPDGSLAYQVIPTPDGLLIERNVMVTMPDGVKLACNVYRPAKAGKFPVILSMTPYGKDQTPPTFKPDGSPLPNTYAPYILRVYAHGADLGHMKISMLAPWEGPDPAFWVPHGYVVIIVDRRGDFKSEGKTPGNAQQGDDIFHMIEWTARQEWSDGNVGMVGVSALASNQYYAASHQPPSPHLKAIIPWEGSPDSYRDSAFWGGIPETNFTKRDFKEALKKMPDGMAAPIWAAAIDPVRNQKMIQGAPKLELITVPALICASWSDKGLHTRGTFEVYRRIASKDKWLYTHGGKKWERFYSEDGLGYQKKFFDYYLKGIENGWRDTPRIRLEVRETRDEYTVRFEKEFPLARTQYERLYLNARDSSLSPTKLANEGKVIYNSMQGGDASFGMTFDKDTELTGYMKVKLWVSAKEADDMDLFVAIKKFDAQGNEVQFRGMNGFSGDMAAKGQMRVSQRELDDNLSTPWQPVQKFQGEKKLTPGETVPVEIAFLPSSTLFRKGESLRLFIQGRHPVIQTLLFYGSLINRGEHIIHTGGEYDSYLQIPVIPPKK